MMASTTTAMKPFHLTLTTFNILAPCYLRMKHGRESQHPTVYHQRNNNIMQLFKRNIDTDILFLQEFWFTQEFVELYETGLTNKAHYGQRTNAKEDGVSMWLLSDQINQDFRVVYSRNHPFKDAGDRTVLLVHLESVSDPSIHILLLNTHLTFPHNHFDENVLRKSQIERITDLVDLYIRQHPEVNFQVILGGDFNVKDSKSDYVLSHLAKCGYNASMKGEFYSHLTHKNTLVPADNLFFKGSRIKLDNCYLYPKDSVPDKWDNEWSNTMSDHRPLVASFTIE